MDYRIIYHANLWVFVITAIAYLTVFLGFMAEFVMLAVQFITAVYLSLNSDLLSADFKDSLNFWWFTTAFSALLLFGLPYIAGLDPLLSGILFFCVVPMINGALMVRMLFRLKEEDEKKNKLTPFVGDEILDGEI